MPVKKSQHYVPRFILRNFSEDGASVCMMLLGTGRVIRGASIAGQCARDYFYGKDLSIEDAFSSIEGSTAALLRGLKKYGFHTLRPEGADLLRLFLHYQKFRTLGAADDFNASIEAIGRAVSEAGPPGYALSIPEETSVVSQTPQIESLHSAAFVAPTIFDLEVKILTRTKPPGFMVSDDPVMSTNQWAEHHPRFRHLPSLTASALVGLQLFCPISPSACLGLYDSGAYRYGNERSFAMVVSPDDVRRLNTRQVFQGRSCVYFSERWTSEPELEALQAERSAQSGSREPTVVTGPMTEPSDGKLSANIEFTPPEIRLGLRFDFAKVILLDKYEGLPDRVIPVRSPELIELAERYRRSHEAAAAEAKRSTRKRG